MGHWTRDLYHIIRCPLRCRPPSIFLHNFQRSTIGSRRPRINGTQKLLIPCREKRVNWCERPRSQPLGWAAVQNQTGNRNWRFPRDVPRDINYRVMYCDTLARKGEIMGIKRRRQRRQRDQPANIFRAVPLSVPGRNTPANEMTVLMKLDDRLPVQQVRGERRINTRTSTVAGSRVADKRDRRRDEIKGMREGRDVDKYYNSFVTKYRVRWRVLGPSSANESRDTIVEHGTAARRTILSTWTRPL